MKSTWLILDCNYLAWRAYHSKRDLRYRGQATGVIFGILQDVIGLRELHNTDNIVFCFDHSRKYLKRKIDCPGYKSSRDKLNPTEEEQKMFKEVHQQIRELRKTILPTLGFRNVFAEKGYEADDLIASVVCNLREGDHSIIVGADHDLYQLLGTRTIIWNPTKAVAVTAESFSKEYGVTPSQWIDAKAIAGCKSDDVPGIAGIGEKTACKFLNGTLKSGSVAFNKIVAKEGNRIWRRNKPLVKLPYPRTPVFKLRQDKLSKDAWQEVCEKYGFKSFGNISIGETSGKEKAKTKAKKKSREGFEFREEDL